MPASPSLRLLALLGALLLAACPKSSELGEGSGEGECSNGVDDDGDGRVDCRDEGCFGSAECEGVDAGPLDAGRLDAGRLDAGRLDAGPGRPDVGLPPPDSGGPCEPAPERCNGADDDCDGFFDEEPELLCAPGEICVGGACECEEGSFCGGECVDTSSDPAHCGGCGRACPEGDGCVDGRCCGLRTERLDLLFVVDDSRSMVEEQRALTAALPRLVRALASGDADGDGGLDFPPVESLHVGVVTPNMGTGGVPVPTCSEPALGDDGILQTAGSTAAGCRSSYPSVLTFEPGAGADPDAFARDVGCLATQGTDGCGFEQQLDAALKAVTPSSSPIRFVSGTTGHADGANAGFLREDALLGIVMVTDEDDCSAADPDLFNPRSTEYTGDLNLRCFQYPEALHPLARYADLVAGRDPDRVFFSLITGIPPEIEPAPGTPIDYAGILAHPDMQARIDPAEPIRLAPSCRDAAGMALAYPPVRLVQAARQLETTGATATLTSSCQDDFGGFVDGVLERLSEGVVSSCAP